MASRTSSANDNIFGAQTGESGFRTKLREIFNRYQEQWELDSLKHHLL